MEIKVREVSGSEEKSKQEIEQELLQKHEEQLEGNIGIDTSKLEVASAPKEEEVVKEETNGITSLACMQYQDTPDFSGSGRPTNKNAAFVKKCKEGNRHIGGS